MYSFLYNIYLYRHFYYILDSDIIHFDYLHYIDVFGQKLERDLMDLHLELYNLSEVVILLNISDVFNFTQDMLI